MKINLDTTLVGKNILLVPYMKQHVAKYHEWMQDDELLRDTASERLSIEQEYEMQQKWCHDEDKCTFIVLSLEHFAQTSNEIESMIGDVNLFFNNMDDKREAEIEVMIAESKCRNHGLGKEAVLAMMFYGYKELNVKKFKAIIGNSNKKSQSLFSKFGYVKVKETDAFEESTYMLEITNDGFTEILSKACKLFRIEKYPIDIQTIKASS